MRPGLYPHTCGTARPVSFVSIASWCGTTLRELSHRSLGLWSLIPSRSSSATEGTSDSVREAEREVSTFRHGAASARGLLVYVPDAPLPDEDNLLLPLECLGMRVVRTLRQEASVALRDRVPQAQRDEWFSVDGLTLDKLDELARAGAEIGSLAVVFGEVTPSQVAWTFLSDPTDTTLKAIETATQVVPLRDLLVREFGVPVP